MHHYGTMVRQINCAHDTLVRQIMEKRAAKGAALLDKVLPGWEAYVDWTSLDLDSVTHCVLGQLAQNDPRIRGRYRMPTANPFRRALIHIQNELGYQIEIGDNGFTSSGYNARMARVWAVEIDKRMAVAIKLRKQERAREAAKKDLRILPPDEVQLAKLLDKSAYELVA